MSISAVGGGASAYQTQQMRPPKPPDEAEAKARFEELDTNGDGGLSLEESGLTEEEFSAFDVDGDGLLTEADREAKMAEMEAQMSEMGGPPPGGGGPGGPGGPGGGAPPEASELIDELDTNGDGVVSEAESKMSSEMFAEFDSDGDGSITLEEFEAAAAAKEAEMASMQMPTEMGSFMTQQGIAAYQAQSDMNLATLLSQSFGSQSGWSTTA